MSQASSPVSLSRHAAITADAWPVWSVRIASLLLPSALIAAVLLQPYADPKLMFLDALAAAEFAPACCRPYFGFVSMLGIMLWVTTAAVCLFSALILLCTGARRGTIQFALFAGLFTGWLALDDAFLLHEVILPEFGVPQNAVLATIALLAAGYALVAWRRVMASDPLLFLAAGAALATSMAVDTIFHSLDAHLVYLEDGAKFIGIFCWTTFHVSTMARILLAGKTNGAPRR